MHWIFSPLANQQNIPWLTPEILIQSSVSPPHFLTRMCLLWLMSYQIILYWGYADGTLPPLSLVDEVRVQTVCLGKRQGFTILLIVNLRDKQKHNKHYELFNYECFFQTVEQTALKQIHIIRKDKHFNNDLVGMMMSVCEIKGNNEKLVLELARQHLWLRGTMCF